MAPRGRSRSGPPRRGSALLYALLTATLLGCFEDPVEETLQLRFDAAGQLGVRARVVLNWLDDGKDNAPFTERMLEMERGLLEGWHPWQERFLDVAALGDGSEEVVVADGESWERAAGRLVRWEHWALVNEPGGALRTVFADTPVEAQFRARAPELGGGGELSFYVLGGDRATRRERERVEDALEDWSVALAEYLETTIELWHYLETNPRRAVTVIRGMFEDMTDDDVDLSDLEEDLIERNNDASDAVLTIFELRRDETSTLQEASRRVFDPFPARLMVEVPGQVTAVEGLVPATLVERGRGAVFTGDETDAARATRFTVPRLSLWDAFRALEGTWVAPDPLLTRVRHLMEAEDEDEDLDVEAFLAQDFFYRSSPDRADVRKAVLDALRPADFYRLEWRSEAPVPSPR